MAPGEVQSVVMDYSGANASSIVNVMAHGLPDYSSVMNDFFGQSLASKVAYRSLRFEDISHPPPEAYYLQPTPASGCNFTSPDVQCSTIFEGQYRALISLPSEVTGLQGPWRTCTPVIYGVYDPPLALTEASYAAGITMPHGGAPTEYQTHKSEAPAAAPTPPDITVPRTAPASTPQATGAGRIPPAESAVLPPGSGSSDTSGGGSGGADGSGSGSNENGSGENGSSGSDLNGNGSDSSDSNGNGNGNGNGSGDSGSNSNGSSGEGAHSGSGQSNGESGSGPGSGSGSQSENGSQSAGQGSNGGNSNSGDSDPHASASGASNGDAGQEDASNSGQSSRTGSSTGAVASATRSSAASNAFETHWHWSTLIAFGLIHFAIT